MNTLIRFLTFSAARPTHVYERAFYMLARGLLALAALAPAILASPARSAPWIVVSTALSLIVAWSSQVARSGASRRLETRKKHGEKDVALTCDAELFAAASVGSFVSSAAPLVALGQGIALSSSRAGVAAAVLSALGSLFDVAWSTWIFPWWRARYTTERDGLRTVAAVLEHGAAGLPRPNKYVVTIEENEDAPTTDWYGRWSEGRSEQEYPGISVVACVTNEHEDAPTTVFTGSPIRKGGKDFDLIVNYTSGATHAFDKRGEMFSYVRCASLDDLLSRTSESAPVGTRLYVNDDSPIVEYGGAERGWFVDWHDGTTSPVSGLYDGEERARFVAMTEEGAS